MKAPLKLTLPIVIGTISGLLMVWDISNQKVIESRGMDWDTGAPLWPYQTPDTLINALNFPAAIVANLSSKLLRLELIGSLHYWTLFPAIVALWWLIGAYLDSSTRRGMVQQSLVRASLFATLALCFILLGAEESVWAFRWWWTSSRNVLASTDLIFLRLIAPSAWCFLFAAVALRAAWRRGQVIAERLDS